MPSIPVSARDSDAIFTSAPLIAALGDGIPLAPKRLCLWKSDPPRTKESRKNRDPSDIVSCLQPSKEQSGERCMRTRPCANNHHRETQEYKKERWNRKPRCQPNSILDICTKGW